MYKVILIFSSLWALWFVYAEDLASSPLLLTPLLKNNNIEEARRLSRVTPDLGNVESYSGYFTVNKNETCGNNLFFWFFPAVKNWQSAPVLLWLQGGPGYSSMYGVFELNGPFNSLPEGLVSRNTSWTNLANIIYIDNPVGAGFSFSTNKCYPQNISVVTDELYSGLKQFFKLFPELLKNDFYITGESFGGHYIPALGTYIDQKNSKKGIKINLKGIVMGNPLMKLTCHDFGSFLYQVGIADESLQEELYKAQKSLKNHVEQKNYTAAHEDYIYILSDLIDTKTGIPDRYTILTEPKDPSTYIKFLNTSEIQKQLHTLSQEFIDFNTDVYDSLSGTIAEPFDSHVQKLLQTKKYIVAFYSGNLDILCMYTSAVCIMRGLEWSGQEEYLKAKRNIWYLNNEVVGWFKTADNLLLDIVVKDAQHAAIYSKPEVTYRMIESIISAKPGQNPLWALNTTVPAENQ